MAREDGMVEPGPATEGFRGPRYTNLYTVGGLVAWWKEWWWSVRLVHAGHAR